MHNFKEAFVRGIAYALAFAVVLGLGGLFFMQLPRQPRTATPDAATARYMQTYEKQMAQGQALLDQSERYYDRADAALDHQERLLKRLDVVVGKWETAGPGIQAKQP